MKHLLIAVSLAGLSVAGDARAVTLDAGAYSTFVNRFQVNDGDVLPPGIVAASSAPESSVLVQSDLDAADAVNVATTTTNIAGGSAADPSEFAN